MSLKIRKVSGYRKKYDLDENGQYFFDGNNKILITFQQFIKHKTFFAQKTSECRDSEQ